MGYISGRVVFTTYCSRFEYIMHHKLAWKSMTLLKEKKSKKWKKCYGIKKISSLWDDILGDHLELKAFNWFIGLSSFGRLYRTFAKSENTYIFVRINGA